MNDNDLQPWTTGMIAASIAWVVYVFFQYLRYRYARYVLEQMGSTIIPNLYPDPPQFPMMFLALLVFLAVGAIIGYLIQKFSIKAQA